VAISHSEVLNVEFEHPITPDEARALMASFPGVVVVDDPANDSYPMPIDAAGQDDTFVGRVRQDPALPNALAMWVVSDNLRKGAATNAIQIAEEVVKRGAWLRERV
jgi:aspartate-semialdehyde dehydrogenase